jgi:hypothetical protein
MAAAAFADWLAASGELDEEDHLLAEMMVQAAGASSDAPPFPHAAASAAAAVVKSAFLFAPGPAFQRWGRLLPAELLAEHSCVLAPPPADPRAQGRVHPRGPPPAAAEAAVRQNRRLAKAAQLERDGVFFSLDAMRQRCPALYRRFFCRGEAAAAAAAVASAPNDTTWSAELLRLVDAADECARVRQADDDHDDDDHDDGDDADTSDPLAALMRAMRARFLAGREDATCVDYVLIDGDAALVDDATARNDAEDAYFAAADVDDDDDDYCALFYFGVLFFCFCSAL